MRNILITGSADGIGSETARQLIELGHTVVLHARDERRAADALAAAPGAVAVLTGDLASIAQTRALADRANTIGRFDAIIHNAGVGFRERRQLTEDGVEHVFAINVLAPYILTALVQPPGRLIHVSSGLHHRGQPELSDLRWERRAWDGMQAYCDSKLFDVTLAFAVARLRPDVLSNAMEPGWVRTRMGGPEAPSGVAEGADTQVWLAESNDWAATVSGRLFARRGEQSAQPAAGDLALQDALLDACQRCSGIELATTVGSGARRAG